MRLTTLLVNTGISMLLAGNGVAGQVRVDAGIQASLRVDVGLMNARLGSGGRSPRDVVSDARRLSEGYRALGPNASGFDPDDRALNRDIAGQSFAWLSRARLLHLADPSVAAQLMETYATIGAFYRDYGDFYPEGARTAFGGASELARMLVLRDSLGQTYEQELSRYALASAVANAGSPAPGAPEATAPSSPQAATVARRVELPVIDADALTAEQRAQWADIRDQFRIAAARVHEARVRIDELSARLKLRGMTINVTTAATAATMEGFLEDAVELSGAHEFRMASLALTRVEYTRGKLRSVLGE